MHELPDRELLNAYVDGELDASTAAEIMDAAAADPAIAREISALLRMKAALAATVEVPELRLPPEPASRPIFARAAIAATLLLTLAAATVLRSALPGATIPIDAAWTAAAHASWTAAESTTNAPMIPAGADASAPPAYIPDLGAARLRVVHVARRNFRGAGRALVVGYAGTRGCRVTFAISPRVKGLGDGLRPFEAGSLKGFAWRLGTYGFYVLADGMSEKRLEGIAGGIREASLRHLPLSPDTRTALSRARRESLPCRA